MGGFCSFLTLSSIQISAANSATARKTVGLRVQQNIQRPVGWQSGNTNAIGIPPRTVSLSAAIIRLMAFSPMPVL
jgi:hypothetical protein